MFTADEFLHLSLSGKSGGELLHLNPESRILITAEDCDVASLSSLSPEVISDPTFQVIPINARSYEITHNPGESELL